MAHQGKSEAALLMPASFAAGEGGVAASPLRVIVLTPGVGGLGGISRMMDNVEDELRARSDDTILVRFISTRGDIRYLKPLVFLQAMLRVGFSCAAGRCDLLHVNLASSGSTFRKLVLGSIADACGVPYVLHLHGAEYREFWASRGRLVSTLINRFFRRAASVIVLGKAWEDLVNQRVPEAAARIVILPNATRAPDLSPTALKADGIVIAFLGQLGRRKGIPELVSALSSLPRTLSWRAVLGGDGDLQEARNRVRELGLADRVEIPGWVGPERVDGILRRADIFALPSHAENLPMSIIEAFAYGVPVVSTPVGSVPEMIEDGQNGLIVPVGDRDALADALLRLMQDKKLRETLARNALATHEARYGLASHTDRLVALWRAVSRQ